MTASAQWWHAFFDATYADIGLTPQSPKEIAAQEKAADFIIDTLGLSPGDTVFDQCCGIGRISLPLAQKGMKILGVDLAPGYAQKAAAFFTSQKLSATFHTADAFEFVAESPCDGGINWFSSFGYHPDDDQNLKMLKCAHASLKPGAKFIIDFIGVPFILKEFRVAQCLRRKIPGGELLLIEEPTMDFVSGMFQTRWTYVFPDGRREERHSANRIYMPYDLVRLMERAGFEDVEVMGNLDGSPFTRMSPRTLAIGTRR